MGTGICIVLSILQPCYFRFMIKQRGIMRLALFNLITTWGFIGCVLAWRGTWELYDLLLVFGNFCILKTLRTLSDVEDDSFSYTLYNFRHAIGE